MEDHFRDNVLPEICKYYEKDICRVKKFEIKPLPSVGNNWLSVLYELEFVVSKEDFENSGVECYNLFVKCLLDDCNIREVLQNVKQFSNEIHFYATVKPVLCKFLPGDTKIFVEVPYAKMKNVRLGDKLNSTDAIIVMENLTVQGYRLGRRGSLDLQHCRIALQQLGRLHAASLITKGSNPEQFHEKLMNPFQESRFVAECEDMFRSVYQITLERVYTNCKYLSKEEARKPMALFQEKCQDAYGYLLQLRRNSRQSELAVLCHGDFCRNNILYKYDENGVPIEAILIDYQFSCYGSPVIDLSSLIYSTAKCTTRKNDFMTMLETYHQSLDTTMREILSRSEEETSTRSFSLIPSFDSIVDDFRRYGMEGLITALMFVPWGRCSEEELKNISECIMDYHGQKFRDLALTIGGEACTKFVVELFEDAILLHGLEI